jgi:plasmid stabilization system protein ParE
VSLPVILRPDAETDVRDIHAYLENARPGMGDKFSAQLRKVLTQIESMPAMFAVVWKDVRAVRLRRFRFVVYYVVFSDRAEVLAVMHGGRDAPAWQARR